MRRVPLSEALHPTRKATVPMSLVAPSGVLASSVELADSPWRRTRGLLGRRALDPGHAVVIAPCRQVHTIGMKFPIDVVFCDAALHVLAVSTMVPGKLGKSVRKATFAIELREGGAANVSVGDALRLEAS